MTTKDNATDSANIGSNTAQIGSDTAQIGSDTKPLPPAPAPAPAPGSEVDDALDQIEDATNAGGVWGRPRR